MNSKEKQNNITTGTATQSLNGKVAIITGSARNIGRNTALKVAQNSAQVITHYHSDSSAEAIVSLNNEISAMGMQSTAYQADLCNSLAAQSLFDFAESTYGKVDLLVNTAGTFHVNAVVDTPINEFDKVFNIHAKAPFMLFKQAVERLNSQGRIINISTSLTAAQRGHHYSVYAAAKAAAEQLTKFLAEAVAHKEITVNSISPGPLDNSFLRSVESEPALEFLGSLSLFNRLGISQDIAAVITFLLSEDARWITGQNIRVNGGMI